MQRTVERGVVRTGRCNANSQAILGRDVCTAVVGDDVEGVGTEIRVRRRPLDRGVGAAAVKVERDRRRDSGGVRPVARYGDDYSGREQGGGKPRHGPRPALAVDIIEPDELAQPLVAGAAAHSRALALLRLGDPISAAVVAAHARTTGNETRIDHPAMLMNVEGYALCDSGNFAMAEAVAKEVYAIVTNQRVPQLQVWLTLKPGSDRSAAGETGDRASLAAGIDRAESTGDTTVRLNMIFEAARIGEPGCAPPQLRGGDHSGHWAPDDGCSGLPARAGDLRARVARTDE